MKANYELGDWVLDTEFDRNRPDTIECLEPHRVWLKDGKLYQPIETIKPIPLTEEILERNGFEARGGGYFVFCYEYGRYIEVVRILLDNNIATTNIQRGDYRDFMTNCNLQVKFVNELQRALRLCKSNKQIKL